MRNYVIVTDSSSDLDKELREKYDIDYIPMHMMLEGKDYPADLDWGDFSVKEFYGILKDGKRFLTAQINVAEYTEAFEKYILAGYDVLSISCSSALSASVKESYAVRDALMAKYPEAKIVCIDSLNACSGLGMMCIRASEMRAEGKSIDEAAAWLEANKLRMNQECSVDSLVYFKRAGRVSAATAFFGGLLNIKPIIISSKEGHNLAVEKVKGRANAINRLADRIAERYVSEPFGQLFVSHADCEEDMKKLKEAILERIPDKDIPVHEGFIGPIIGATAGPGTVAAFFWGKEVTD